MVPSDNPLDRYIHDPDEGVPGYPRYNAASIAPVLAEPQYWSAVQRPPTRQDSYSSSGTSSRQYSDDSSRISASSNASTAPTNHPNQVGDPGPMIPCEFAYIGCEIEIPIHNFESWLSHSESHFAPYNPPTKAICTFCDKDTAVFENEEDPFWNWRKRMAHIHDHFVEIPSSQVRPDFWVLDYLRSIRHISEEDYNHAILYDERPPLENVYPLGYQPQEVAEKKYRESQITHDLGREKREMRRSKQKGRSTYGSSRRHDVKVHPSK